MSGNFHDPDDGRRRRGETLGTLKSDEGIPSRINADDEESNNYFLSEPSASEADSSGHGGGLRRFSSTRGPFNGFTRPVPTDDDYRDARSPQPQHLTTLPSPVPSSPGNTSLSSWESPAWKKGSVQVHFGPMSGTTGSQKAVAVEATSEGPALKLGATSTRVDGRISQSFSTGVHPNHPAPHVPDITQNNPEGVVSKSVPLEPVERTLKDVGKPRSRASITDSSMDESALVGARVFNAMSDVESSCVQIEATNSTDTDIASNIHEPEEKAAFRVSHQSLHSVDESLVMTLSDSDGEVPQSEQLKDTNDTVPGKEETQRLLPISPSSKHSGRHRRQRSGDEMAASLVTGDPRWKGMEQDKIPHPGDADDDDDEDDHVPSGRRNHRQLRHTQGEDKRSTAEESAYSGSKKSSINSGRKGSASSIPPRNPTKSEVNKGQVRRAGNNNPGGDRSADEKGFIAPDLTFGGRYFPSGYSPSGSDSSQHMQSLLESNTAYGDEDSSSSDFSDGERPPTVAENQMRHTHLNLREEEHLYESREYRGARQSIVRHSHSPFVNLGKTSTMKAQRSSFLPRSINQDDDKSHHVTYICPVCNTRQRAFFSVTDAPRQVEGPSAYLAFYFSIYVISSLFIFGLEEGWNPLDCIYFAVITLTTAGLGDFVPTTDANKIICSIFIYFGVACIGLLLGSYIAGMLDDRASREAKRNQSSFCPNCAHVKGLREKVVTDISYQSDGEGHFASSGSSFIAGPPGLPKFSSQREASRFGYSDVSRGGQAEFLTPPAVHGKRFDAVDRDSPSSTATPIQHQRAGSPGVRISPTAQNHLGSPVTQSILGRQRHTRHESFDIGSSVFSSQRSENVVPIRSRGFSEDPESRAPLQSSLKGIPSNHPTRTSVPPLRPVPAQRSGTHPSFPVDERRESTSVRKTTHERTSGELGSYSSDDSSTCSESSYGSFDQPLDDKTFRMKAAKYVFLTLKQALVNSMVIIAAGCVGFWVIEKFTLVDSWYFTTVLLTTVGYGDIVPVTKGGKLFATVYILVAGTILLNNMSLISMIPLELRKRRIERAVLTQFGDQLDDAALEELATGPVVQRLRLSEKQSHGLNECTREMFSLAMLVRLGKVSEQDIKQTFAAFRRLDVNDEGVLNSKTIIDGMVKKRRLQAMSTNRPSDEGPPPPPPLQPPPPPSAQRPTPLSYAQPYPTSSSPHIQTPTGFLPQYLSTTSPADINPPVLLGFNDRMTSMESLYAYPPYYNRSEQTVLLNNQGGPLSSSPSAMMYHPEQQFSQQNYGAVPSGTAGRSESVFDRVRESRAGGTPPTRESPF